MNKLLIAGFIFWSSVIAWVSLPIKTTAQDFPITKITLVGAPMSDVDPAAGELIVPDTDTTLSAYGGRLRRYDVHMAKMFELTIQMCRGSRNGDVFWTYKAGNGNIDMGNFRITCALADDVKIAYGLGRTERTVVRTERGATAIEVPILRIGEEKIDRWMNFVENFKPVS